MCHSTLHIPKRDCGLAEGLTLVCTVPQQPELARRASQCSYHKKKKSFLTVGQDTDMGRSYQPMDRTDHTASRFSTLQRQFFLNISLRKGHLLFFCERLNTTGYATKIHYGLQL